MPAWIWCPRLAWSDLQGFEKLLRKRGQRAVKVFVVDDDVLRHAQADRRKIPNGADAARHHQIRHGLRFRRRHGDDADENVHPLREIRQFFQRQNVFAVDFRADFRRIQVKCRHDLQPALFKFAIAQQRRAHAAGADEKGVVDIIPAEKLFQFLDHVRQHIADARTANDADRLQILPHLRRVQVQIQPDVRAGNGFASRRLPFFQEAVIQRQPLQRRFRDDFQRRPVRSSKLGFDIHIVNFISIKLSLFNPKI